MAQAKKGGTAVAKKPDAAVAMWEEETDTGFEDTTSDDYAMPFFKLLQKGSPEVDEDSSAYVKGAKPGMYFNTASKKVYDQLLVIPCHYYRAMVEWRDRDEGGGFVGQHPVGFEAKLKRNERGQWITPEGNYVADTRYFFVIAVDENSGENEVGVISFSSTQLKKARAWMTQMQALKATRSDGSRFTLPMYSHMYRLTSIGEENQHGSWKGYNIEKAAMIDDPELARQAKDARDMFRNAAANLKPPAEDGAREPGADDIPY